MNTLRDETYGIGKEIEIFSKLKELHGSTLIKTPNKYSSFDFENDNCVIELKSRRNTKNAYPTTMVGFNKILKANKENRDVYFYFNFTDGLYRWKYDPEQVNTFAQGKGGRSDRGCVEMNTYTYIPVKNLTLC